MMRVTISPIVPSSVASLWLANARRMGQNGPRGQDHAERPKLSAPETGHHLAGHPELSPFGMEAGRHGAVWQYSQGARSGCCSVPGRWPCATALPHRLCPVASRRTTGGRHCSVARRKSQFDGLTSRRLVPVPRRLARGMGSHCHSPWVGALQQG
jgi:hypothetical protein